MSAAGRGFMNNLSNERLLQRLQQFEAAGSDARAMDDSEFADECEDVACVIRELLALREAGKEPVAVVLVEEDTSEQHRVAWTVKGQNLTDGRHELYAAQQLPAVIKLPSTRLWAGITECYEKTAVIAAIRSAGVEVSDD